VLYVDRRENSQSYFHTLQALDVSPMCEAADAKSIIQLFPHSSQQVTGNSSHSLSDAQLQIIYIRTLRDFLSIHTQDMDLASVGFVKSIFECVYLFLNNPV
jgi:predicted ABC-type exoprotein transport system permease subunit